MIITLGFLDSNRSPKSRPDDQTLRELKRMNKNKRTCRIVDFAIPADHRAKLKESEKRNKYT